MKTLNTLGLALMLATIATASSAKLPRDYGAVAFGEALAQAQQDGKPVLVYFGEDW